ncbi:MAG TPA: hypothetical protein VFG50_01800 [Rhodothermales bacterium]|nr:hypothetical protein [Rhodothermales bacterium]
MAWDIRNTYFYLVCFATLMMVVIGAAQVVDSALDLAIPRASYAPTVSELEMRYNAPRGPNDPPRPSHADLERMAREEAERSERQQRRDALRRLLGNVALVVIAAPVYLYHWRQVRRS